LRRTAGWPEFREQRSACRRLTRALGLGSPAATQQRRDAEDRDHPLHVVVGDVRWVLAASLAGLGRFPEAKFVTAQVLALSPNFTIAGTCACIGVPTGASGALHQSLPCGGITATTAAAIVLRRFEGAFGESLGTSLAADRGATNNSFHPTPPNVEPCSNGCLGQFSPSPLLATSDRNGSRAALRTGNKRMICTTGTGIAPPQRMMVGGSL
jgi:hypothetical protein